MSKRDASAFDIGHLKFDIQRLKMSRSVTVAMALLLYLEKRDCRSSQNPHFLLCRECSE
jgi:hypothetical protein